MSLTHLAADLARWEPVAGFPWHAQQLRALEAAPDVLCLPAGNRGGKTEVAAGIVALLVRRTGPIYRRLRRPEGRPLRVWVAPQTLEKYTSNWRDRLAERVFRGVPHTATANPWPVWRWEDDLGGGELWGKSQDQGWRSFESDDVDLVVFDEEPTDPKLLTSAITRTGTTNGVVVLAYTPLLGLTFTYHALVEPTMRDGVALADRHWRMADGSREVIQWGMADNPLAVAGGGVRRLVADPTMSEAERAARLYGDYGFTEGLLFPALAGLRMDRPGPHVLDALPDDRPYSWTLTVDPNKRHGGLLMAQDHEDNRYCVLEHFAEGWPDPQHAAMYKQMMQITGMASSEVPTFADPGGAGAQAILNLAECDVWATAVPKGPGSVKASIDLVNRLLWADPAHPHPVSGVLGAPRLYFVRSLRTQWMSRGVTFNESRLVWELRQYRQDPGKPPGTPIKEYDDLVDCLRYHALVRPVTPDPEAWAASLAAEKAQTMRAQLDRLSQRAHDEYDELAARAARPRTPTRWNLT